MITRSRDVVVKVDCEVRESARGHLAVGGVGERGGCTPAEVRGDAGRGLVQPRIGRLVRRPLEELASV